MPIHNSDVAALFNRIADLLDIKGDNPFRIRAYRDAARTVEELPGSVSAMIAAGEDLTRLPGIGKDLAGKIKEIVATGSLTALEKIAAQLPPDLVELLKISGLGPRKVGAIHKELGIHTLAALEHAISEKKIRALAGFGPKTEENIREEIQRLTGGGRRLKLIVADEIGQELLKYLKQIPGVKEVAIAGSYRRRKETVGDLDILVTHRKNAAVMERVLPWETIFCTSS